MHLKMRTNLIPAFISPTSSQSYQSQRSPHSIHQLSSSSSQNVAAQIVSYDRIGSSEDSQFQSMSQATTHSRAYEESATDSQSRSQVRFQEFVARSRHLESLEILHDIKKRMIFIEELSVAQNHKLSEQFQQLQQKVETDATRAINLTIQANNAQNAIIGEIRTRLDSYQFNFERLERKLSSLEDQMKSIQVLPVRYEYPMFTMFPQEEGMTLEEYLKVKRGNPKLIREGSCDDIANGLELDLWDSGGEVVIESSVKSDKMKQMQEEKKEDKSDHIDIDPWMTVNRNLSQIL